MKIAFLGDSITLGYALEDRKDRFSTLVSQKLGAEEINLGITGTLVAKAGLSRDNGTAYIDRIEQVKDGDIVVIFGGTNDYFWSDRPIDGVGEDYFAYAFEKICDTCEALGKKDKLLVITPYKHNGTGNYKGGADFKASSTHDTSDLNFNGHTIEDYANKINEICKKRNIKVLDLQHTDGFDWKKLTVDGCHPNPDGHKWIAQKVVDALKDFQL